MDYPQLLGQKKNNNKTKLAPKNKIYLPVDYPTGLKQIGKKAFGQKNDLSVVYYPRLWG